MCVCSSIINAVQMGMVIVGAGGLMPTVSAAISSLPVLRVGSKEQPDENAPSEEVPHVCCQHD